HDNLVHDPMDLIDDTVSVRVNSSYFHRLRHLSEEIGGRIVIDTLPGKYSTDEIIKMVADGTLKYTVADKNIASISASYYPNLDINVPMSFSQRIAWALPKWDTTLVGAVNEWLAGMKESSDYYAIYNKYFRNERNFRRRVKSEFYSLNENKISPFDDIIREGARTIGWDWRLLASMIYQESKFLPDAESWAEARGLMQIMPSTAEELGIGDVLDPHENISGGVRYLANLESYFEMIPDSLERIKFTLASFNCGVGHVLDARRLAKKHGLNPNVWKGNVEEMALKLSFPEYFNDPVVYYGYVRGEEPYTYVNQIFERYAHYRRFIPLSEEDVKAEES
ncbi:MAG TPA: transglycosylase SLT domain-containing protein, partial [Cryomorphaceae bacterium]|nr:transglycosylase SLT domain-containing protein [Cryomorphaceae bacterium]